MHIDELTVPDLNIPFIDLDIQNEELILEDLPSMDEVLKNSQAMFSLQPTAGQTPYSERICIRINRGVLAEIKKRAEARGVRYQTFINLLLTQCAASGS